MLFCKHKDIFGKPGTGVHSTRLFNIAVWDVVMTILGGIFISLISGYDMKKAIIGTFISGIIIHRLFCVRTTLDKLIFN